MSRSSPPSSSFDAEVPPASSVDDENGRAGGRTRRRTLALRLAALMRWLHIYLSMFGLAAVLFFSVTGITLNHPDWFSESAERTVEANGRLNLDWVRPPSSIAPDSAVRSERDRTDQAPVEKLEVVEFLRRSHGVRGALADFQVDELECTVVFKGPGYAADAVIDRETGSYRLTETSHGLVAVLNDLHKGRDAGAAWSVLIDVSAVALSVVSITGLVLLFYLKRRRLTGLVVAVVGAVVVLAVAALLVP